MADENFSSNIVIDPQTLLGVQQAIFERISPQAGLTGFNLLPLAEQLRLLFIDTQHGTFVFGAPDQATLVRANLHTRAALEKGLREIFEEQTRVELVIFDDRQNALADLIAEFTGRQKEQSPEAAGQAAAASSGQGPGDAQAPPAHQASQTASLNKVQLGLLQNNLRSVFTSPKRVVVVPGYLLRWLPYLGPLRTSILVACFQAFYLSRRAPARTDAGLRSSATFEAPGPFLAALAGIAESSIWRHLDDPELGWFLKKVPYTAGEQRWIRDVKAGLTKKRPTRFLFRSISPLTPGDAAALRTYLQDLDIQDDPVGILTDLVRGDYRIAPRDVFPFPPPPPVEGWQQGDPDRCLIHSIIFAAIGMEAKTATKQIANLVDELVERLLPANDQLHLSWYFLLHWQPLLGHGPGWATILLRDRCFYNRQTGELRDTVSVRGGYQELADALGLQRVKTVREWFPAPHAQKDAVKNAALASKAALKKISQSKRSYVKECAAKFVEIADVDADGRGQVSSFKAQIRLFDPLTPTHEALYNALFPLAQRYFSLSQMQKTAFLTGFEVISASDGFPIERIVQQVDQSIAEFVPKYGLSLQPSESCQLDEAALADILGAIERITNDYLGAYQRINPTNLGAEDRITTEDPGAIEVITPPELGGFERLAALFAGVFERIQNSDAGAFEKMGLVFWAYMRGLKHLVLNNHLDESLLVYFQNTEALTSTTTTGEPAEPLVEQDRVAAGNPDMPIKKWDLDHLLNNFSPPAKRDLLEKGTIIPAVISCLFYIASSKGDNLGLGYVVEKLKAHPRDGQGGIYRRLAEEAPGEILAKLRSYLERRSFQNRAWRVAMGSPTTEKILELLEHLGIDSSQFGSHWE